jgi:hypothetical protein
MMASRASGELALALDNQAAPRAFLEGLSGGELQIEFEHGLS